MLAHMEIHPVNTRVVCLNYPQLQPSWIFKALSSSLECCYNHHQLQVIWYPGSVHLPAPRTLKLRGHASHTVQNTGTPLINGFFQTGTYLVFYIPPRVRMVGQSCLLVLNGVESASKSRSHSKFELQLLKNSEEEPPDQENEAMSEEGISFEEAQNHNLNTLILKEMKSEPKHPGHECNHIYPVESRKSIQLDFKNTDAITMLVEEELLAEEGDSDSSDDIHKIVRKQLTTDIQPVFTQWKSSGDNLLILLLRPAEKHQAWQFLSAWLQITIEETEEATDSEVTSTLVRAKRKGLTRTKPISPTVGSALTLKRQNKTHINGTLEVKVTHTTEQSN